MEIPVSILLISLLFHSFCAALEFTSTDVNAAECTAAGLHRLPATPELGDDDITIKCDTCHDLVSGILYVLHHFRDTLFGRELTGDLVVLIAELYCKEKNLADWYICSHIIPKFKDEVLTVFDKAPINVSYWMICTYKYKLCADPDPFNIPWTIDVPGDKPEPHPYPVPKKGAPVNRILHITDIHWDPHYTEGLSTQCGEPLCCRPPNKKGNSPEDSAGAWGDEHCDIPYETLLNLMEHLNNTQEQFDWVYVTGDLPAHNDWTQTRDGQLDILQNITDLFKTYLPGKPIFFAIGNHESVPVNSFPPPYINDTNQSESWLYDMAADQWEDWLSHDATKTLKYGGYYAMDVLPDLKVISLQTNFCSKQNWWLLINSTDPADMLEWLIKELLASEKAGQKVHLIGHIPSNNYPCMVPWAKAFHKIVFRFESTITGYFYGHTHTDKFYVIHAIEEKSQPKRPIGIGYVAPSLTGYQSHSAAFRSYVIDGTYNGSSRTVLDHHTYIMSITDANLTNKPKWVLEYSAKNAYDLSSLSPQSWEDLIERFREDDKLFQKFYKFYYKSSFGKKECHGKCKAKVICYLKQDLPDQSCDD